MSSPPPFDPYLALGISNDADLSTIRSAHRKLVLKFHPDRIKDETERAKGREEFQKVQQAYELLSDSTKRLHYDDRVKLAQLRKEALTRDMPMRGSPYFSRPPPFSTTQESGDGYFYEERKPMGATFFDDEDRFRDEPARASTRKGDSYERKPSANYADKRSTGWKAGGISIDIALKMQKKAAGAREKVRERDMRAATAKSRDQERRRDASDKYRSGRAYVEVDSASDSDTVTYENISPKTHKAAPSPSTPLGSYSGQRHKEPKYSDDEDNWGRDKHQGWHAYARDYIQRAASDRSRQVSREESSYSYFEPREDRPQARRGESDREEKRNTRERTKASRSRKPSYSEVEVPRDVRSRKPPGMPTTTSAPERIVIPDDRRDAPQAHRASTGKPLRDHQDIPSMPRSKTMPLGASVHRNDNVPHRGSNLKHAETQDSGYGSSSPATPDMGGTSPSAYASATRYQIVDEDDDYSRGHRTIRVEPDDSGRRARSPSKEHQRPTLSTSGARSKASRAATSFTPRAPVAVPPSRPSLSRRETTRTSGQSRDSAHVSRGSNSQHDRIPLYREVSSDEQKDGYKHRVSSKKASMSRVRTQGTEGAGYYQRSRGSQRDDDYYPGSKYKSDLRNPNMGRRPSVY